METTNITFVGAFMAGILSFLSPCVLPLVPSFITYITGISFAELKAEHPSQKVRCQTIIHALLFIGGFTFVFVFLGASATFVGGLLQAHTVAIQRVGGVLIVLFGIHLTGLVPLRFLLGERRVNIRYKSATYVGSFLVGIVFAAGWTPCIGPVLASILMVAATEESISRGVTLLFVYSMGLAVPFFLAALAMHQFMTLFNRFKKYIRFFEIVTGVFLIIVGVLIFTNYLTALARYATILSLGQ